MKPNVAKDLFDKTGAMARAMDETYDKHEKLMQTACDRAQNVLLKSERVYWCCVAVGVANLLLVSLALFLLL